LGEDAEEEDEQEEGMSLGETTEEE